MAEDQGEAAYVVDADVFNQASGELIVSLFLDCRTAEVGADNRSSALVSCDLCALVSEVCQYGDAAVAGEA